MKQEFCCFHVTTKDRLPSILERGLVPNSEPSWFEHKTPYIMLSLYPYWSLNIGEEQILIEIKAPDIKRKYFVDPEGLRWGRIISPKYFNAIVEYKIIKHGNG